MPANIAQLFSRHRATPGRVLYRHFTGEAWEDVTVDEVARRIGRWQAAFRREGFAPGERIALCARNGVNWVAIDQAALGLGLVVVPLYVDDNPDNVAWCVGHARSAAADRRELAHCRESRGSRVPSIRCRRSS